MTVRESFQISWSCLVLMKTKKEQRKISTMQDHQRRSRHQLVCPIQTCGVSLLEHLAAACMGSTEPRVCSDVFSQSHIPLSNAVDTFAFHGKGAVSCIMHSAQSDFVELDESEGDFGPPDGTAESLPVQIKGRGVVEHLVLSNTGDTIHLWLNRCIS